MSRLPMFRLERTTRDVPLEQGQAPAADGASLPRPSLAATSYTLPTLARRDR